MQDSCAFWSPLAQVVALSEPWNILPSVSARLLPISSGSQSGKEFSYSSQACFCSLCIWKTEQVRPEINRFIKWKSLRMQELMDWLQQGHAFNSLKDSGSWHCLHTRIPWGAFISSSARDQLNQNPGRWRLGIRLLSFPSDSNIHPSMRHALEENATMLTEQSLYGKGMQLMG